MADSKFQLVSTLWHTVSGIASNMMRGVPRSAAMLILSGGSQLAIAQVQTNATQSSSADQVEEIVVTAQRRSESLQEVPIAVTAVTSARLEASGIQSTADLQELTPGLTVPDFNGYFEPHIRGVGTSSNGPGIENPIALYIDGVYIADPASALLSLNNVERIEVDKGPQGTLFGRNATGGLVQVITRDPQQSAHLDAEVSYGNYQDVTTRLYATDGLTNDLSADVALRYEYQGQGFGRNLAGWKRYRQVVARSGHAVEILVRAEFGHPGETDSGL